MVRTLSAHLRISVVTCAHNPRAAYFQRVLKALRSQTLSPEDWEYVLVDNASASPVEEALDLSWHPNARVLREETLGLTPARLHGIEQAVGELLVFVDDDNVLQPDYLEQALWIAETHPFLGSWSGQCEPEFETAPPAWTRRYWGNLCIRMFDEPVWSNLPRLPETMPAGAGLCVRRVVAGLYRDLHESGKRRFQFDRTGASLVSGGDNDLAACACRLGLGVGLFPELRLTHLIPPERLTEDYLARLAEGIAFSSTLLDATWNAPTPPRTPIGRLVDFLRTARLPPRDRRILSAFYRGRDTAARKLALEGAAEGR